MDNCALNSRIQDNSSKSLDDRPWKAALNRFSIQFEDRMPRQ